MNFWRRGGLVYLQGRTEEESFFTKAGRKLKINIYLLNIQGITQDKRLEVERIMSEEKDINIFGVTESQLKYKKMEWAGNIKMEEKMRSVRDKKGGGLMIATRSRECLLRRLLNKSDDLLIVEIEVRNVKVVIMQIYLDVKDKKRNRKILKELETNLENVKRRMCY